MLLEEQKRFSIAIANLILKANQLGYGITLGEAHRNPDIAAYYATKKKGIVNSLHTQRLALDICLFKSDIYLTKTSDYQELGEWWESIGGTWGGRFSDGNHFSFEYQGRK